MRRSEEEEDERRAAAVRAAELHLVQRPRPELLGDPVGVERRRLGGGLGPARGPAASRLDRPHGECPPRDESPSSVTELRLSGRRRENKFQKLFFDLANK